jgi:hypothetical protein
MKCWNVSGQIPLGGRRYYENVAPLLRLVSSARSALQRFVDSEFGIQYSSARVSAMPIRILVASRKTIHYQRKDLSRQ